MAFANNSYGIFSQFRRLLPIVTALYMLSPLLEAAWKQFERGVGVDFLTLFSFLTSLLWLGFFMNIPLSNKGAKLGRVFLYFLTAVDLFVLWTFDSRFSSGYMTVVLSDYGEFAEFLTAYYSQIFICFSIFLIVAVLDVSGCVVYGWKRSRARAIFFGLPLVLIYGTFVIYGWLSGGAIQSAFWDLVAKERSAPAGSVFQMALAIKLHMRDAGLKDTRALDQSDVTVDASSVRAPIIVYVIGESSRSQSWSLFGYVRDTTPNLRLQANLIPLSDVVTTAPHTAVAVPSMLSLESIDRWDDVLARKSIVSLFRKAGFKTHWFSTQEADGWGGVIPMIAQEAEVVRYHEHAYDESLLPNVSEAVRSLSSGGRHFIVLHTKGSHFSYQRRYPSQFQVFGRPDSFGNLDVRDAYDNSVRYTDWFLTRLMSDLNATGVPIALFYSSDHGENLMDDGRRLMGHAIGNVYDLHPAAFIWFSDELAKTSSRELMAARNHASSKLSLSNFPHSMLQLGGVKASSLDVTKSVFDVDFQASERAFLVRGELRSELDLIAGNIR